VAAGEAVLVVLLGLGLGTAGPLGKTTWGKVARLAAAASVGKYKLPFCPQALSMQLKAIVADNAKLETQGHAGRPVPTMAVCEPM
jgi:hypothetical protein